MEKKITYYFGAGASANSCPIWNQQADRMVKLGFFLMSDENYKILEKNPFNRRTDFTKWLGWQLVYFGHKATKYNTIDSYARKLFLNGYDDELEDLKLVVSSFFTIWQFGDDLPAELSKDYPEKIDHRYTALLAAILTKSKSGNLPEIPKNYNFISWNYDLQFELAYKSFCPDGTAWREVASAMGLTGESAMINSVCHLNGFHGHFVARDKTTHLKLENDSVEELLKRIQSANFVNEAHYSNHINYAWEKNTISLSHRNRAIQIMKQTDILVIVGYSFPPFNRQIDKEILGSLIPNDDYNNAIYQDLKPTREILSNFIDPHLGKKAKLISDKLDYFEIPF